MKRAIICGSPALRAGTAAGRRLTRPSSEAPPRRSRAASRPRPSSIAISSPCICRTSRWPAPARLATTRRGITSWPSSGRSLYRAADAIDPGGGAREAADALYAELYGLKNKDGARQSLFHYFHGRSSLATWLRSLVTQRFVDQIRAGRRHDPLPEDTSPAAIAARPAAADPDRARFATAMRQALGLAIAALEPRDRLRLGCYYSQEMTLAQIGRLIGEHEASVSRHLTRIRRAIREDVERRLRATTASAIARSRSVSPASPRMPGSIDLGDWLDPEGPQEIRGRPFYE